MTERAQVEPLAPETMRRLHKEAYDLAGPAYDASCEVRGRARKVYLDEADRATSHYENTLNRYLRICDKARQGKISVEEAIERMRAVPYHPLTV